MEQSFPTLEIFKQSAKVPLSYVGSMLISLLILFGGTVLSGAIVGVAIVFSGLDASALLNFVEASQAGNTAELPAFDGLGTVFLAFLVAMFIILLVGAHIFNFWVNLAAHGRQSAHWSFSDGRFGAAAINGLKFMFIGILVGVVQLILTMILSSLGLVPSLAEQAAITEFSAAVLSGLTGTILSVIVGSAVYSVFSANLTQTALRSDAEGMEHPHTVDFAIVLVLLYAIYLVPTIAFALTGLDIMVLIVSLVFGLYLTFTVPVAHGLRYRVCMADRE